MKNLRRVHIGTAIAAGFALAASLYGWPHLSTALLVAVVITLVLSAEALRVLADREKRS